MALAGKNALIKIASPSATTVAGGAMTANSSLEYEVTTAAQRHWDIDIPPAVYENSTLTTQTYDVNYVQGIITFPAGSTVTTPVTADYSYVTAATVAGGREWSLDVGTDLFEVSEFSSSTGTKGWKQYVPNVNGATVTVNRYWSDLAGGSTGPQFIDHIIAESKLITELWVDGSTGTPSGKYEGYAYVTSDQVGAAVDSIVGESVELTINGQLYYSTG